MSRPFGGFHASWRTQDGGGTAPLRAIICDPLERKAATRRIGFLYGIRTGTAMLAPSMRWHASTI
jgi:Na+-transporting NADH:ubiquinone oxidoreductase subunit NqrF